MTRRPFQFVFLAEMKREGVTPGEDLIADVALIFRNPSNLRYHHKFEFKHRLSKHVMWRVLEGS